MLQNQNLFDNQYITTTGEIFFSMHIFKLFALVSGYASMMDMEDTCVLCFDFGPVCKIPHSVDANAPKTEKEI